MFYVGVYALTVVEKTTFQIRPRACAVLSVTYGKWCANEIAGEIAGEIDHISVDSSIGPRKKTRA